MPGGGHSFSDPATWAPQWDGNGDEPSEGPDLSDADTDGLPAWLEDWYGAVNGSPVNMSGDPDSDDDGATDGDELMLMNTDPLDSDTHDDGYNDGTRYQLQHSDIDGDGLSDWDEALDRGAMYGTDPNDADTDDDGLSDGDELSISGTDPKIYDTDDNGVGDHEDHLALSDPSGDFDGDGLTNYYEVTTLYPAGSSELRTLATNGDTDGDGLGDGYELMTTSATSETKVASSPVLVDSDSDGVADGDQENCRFPSDWNDDDPGSLYISSPGSLAEVEAGAYYTSEPFEAAGAGGPFSFSITEGDLPTTFGFDGNVLVGYGPPGVYTFVVSVTNGSEDASAGYSLVVRVPALSISSEPLSTSVTVNADFQWTFAASGGNGGYSWSVSDGTLPQGLTLQEDGLLTGHVEDTVDYHFSVRVTDAEGSTCDQEVTITGTEEPPPEELVITSSQTLSEAQDGSYYIWYFSASGGSPGYTWGLVGGQLPAGLELNTNGTLSGDLLAPPGSYSFNIEVSDSNGAVSAQEVYFNVVDIPPPQLEIYGPSDLALSIWTPFGAAFSCGNNAAGPVYWSLEDEPVGVYISQDGVLQGAVEGEGQYSFVVLVTDPYDTARHYITLYATDRDDDGDGLLASLEHELAVALNLPLHDASSHSVMEGVHDWLIYYNDRLKSTDAQADEDGDGLGPLLEQFLGTNPALKDSNSDFRPDWLEYYQAYGQYLEIQDEDGDGLGAILESLLGTSDVLADSDNDGLPDASEWQYIDYSDPAKQDTDFDGLLDGEELSEQTYARLADTDGDYLSDYEEVSGSYGVFLNPLLVDSDGDGQPDYAEVNLTDSDGGGIPDLLEQHWGMDPADARDEADDYDSDGHTNYEAYLIGWNLHAQYVPQFDDDADGMTNLYEVAKGFDPEDQKDGADDPDYDYLTNAEEYLNHTDPFRALTWGHGEEMVPDLDDTTGAVLLANGEVVMRHVQSDYEVAFQKEAFSVGGAMPLSRGNNTGASERGYDDDWDSDGLSTYEELYPVAGPVSDPRQWQQPLTITTPDEVNIYAGVEQSIPLTQIGGHPPFTYECANGFILPEGFEFVSDVQTGWAIKGTAPEGSAGWFFTVAIQVTDAYQRTAVKDLMVRVQSDVPMVELDLPGGMKGTPYVGQVDAEGPHVPFTYIFNGLPPGLTGDSATGAVTGTPQTEGTFTVSVTVVDSKANDPHQVTEMVDVVIVPDPDGFRIVGTPAGATQGVSYTTTFTTPGGTEPSTLAVSAGTLPPGLVLTGKSITGDPTTAGSYSFTLSATDQSTEPQTATATFTISVGEGEPPPEIILLTSNQNLAIEAPVLESEGYAVQLSSTGGSTPDATYTVTGLPPWLTYNAATKRIVSTSIPELTDVHYLYPIQIVVERGSSASFDRLIAVNQAFKIVAPTELPSGLFMGGYFREFGASDCSGAIGAVIFTLEGFTPPQSDFPVPSQLSIVNNKLNGMLYGYGSYNLRIKATDSAGRMDTKTFTLSAIDPPPDPPDPEPGPGGGNGNPVAKPVYLTGNGSSFVANGGTGNFSWGAGPPDGVKIFEGANSIRFEGPPHSPGAHEEVADFEVSVCDDEGNSARSRALFSYWVPPTPVPEPPDPEPGPSDPPLPPGTEPPPKPVDPERIGTEDGAGPRYRKVGLNGSPMPDAKPQSKDESGENSEETFVDAYSQELRHGVSDIYVNMDSTLMPLMVRRDVTDDIWHEGTGALPQGMPNRPFGAGWSSNLGAVLKIEGKTATVTDEQGATQVFYRQDFIVNGALMSYVWQPSQSEKLDTKSRWNTLEFVDGKYVYRKMFGTTCTFQYCDTQFTPAGNYEVADTHYHRLVEARDRLQNRLLFEYPNSSRIIPSRIHDPDRDGHEIIIQQDPAEPRVTKIIGPAGDITQYTYTNEFAGQGNRQARVAKLIAVTHKSSAGAILGTVGYRYSVANESPTTISTAQNQPWHAMVDRITDERGGHYTFGLQFNPLVQYAVSTNPNVPAAVKSGVPRVVNTVTLPDNSQTTFGGMRNVPIMTSVSGDRHSITTVSGPAGQTTYLFTLPKVYDPPGGGNVILTFTRMDIFPAIATTSLGALGPPAKKETYVFDKDSAMALLSGTDLSGNRTEYTYAGGYDDPVTEVNAVGGTKGFVYDETTRVMTSMINEAQVSTITDVQAGTGLRLAERVYSSTGALLKETLFTYGDSRFKGFLTRQVVNALATTEGAAHFSDMRTDYLADDQGRVWKEIVDPSGIAATTTTTYDAAGRKLQVIDPRGNATSFEYDGRGRLTRTTFPDGAKKRLVYDAHGNVVKEIDENQANQSVRTVFHEYDVLNRRLKSTVDLNGNNVADAGYTTVNLSGTQPVYDGDIVTTTTYNARNQVLTQTDPRGKQTTNTYDELGRPVSKNDGGLITTFEYDEDANFGGSVFDSTGFKPTRATDPRGTVTEVSYDGLYRPTSSTVFYEAGFDAPPPVAEVTASVAQAQSVYDAKASAHTQAVQAAALAAEKVQTLAQATQVADAATAAVTAAQTLVSTLANALPGLQTAATNAETARLAAVAVAETMDDDVEAAQEAYNFALAYEEQMQLVYSNLESQELTALLPAAQIDIDNAKADTLNKYNAVLSAQAAYDLLPGAIDLITKAQAATAAAQAVTNNTTQHGLAVAAVPPLLPVQAHALDILAVVTTADSDPVFKASLQADHASKQGVLTLTSGQKAQALLALQYAQQKLQWSQSYADGGGTGEASVIAAETRTTYDALGKPVKVIDPLGRVTRNVYDHLGQLIKVIEPCPTALDLADEDITDNPTVQTLYTSFGKPWKVIDQMGSATLTSYDKLGRPWRVISPAVNGVSAHVNTTYDKAGNATRVTDALGRDTDTTYDERNRPTQVKTPAVHVGLGTVLLRPTITTTYDALGQPTAVSDPLGRFTTTSYDRAGRKWKVEAPAPATGAPRPTTITGFDAGGGAVTVTNPLNQTVTNTYDLLGRLTKTVDAATITNEFEYDAAGNRTEVKDGKNQVTTFVYDGLNRLVGQTFANGDSWSYLHNQMQKIGQVSPRGLVTNYVYDARDRVISSVCLAHGGTPGLTRTHGYDRAGRLLTVTESGNAAADVSYDYDAMGRVTAESSNGVEHLYSYDLAGNRTQAVYGTGRTVVTTYDALNRPETITEGGRVTRYGYDLAGRALNLQGGNGQTSLNVYDNLGRLKTRTLFKTAVLTAPDAVVLAEFKWEHDALGNVLAQHETWPGETTRQGGIRSTVMEYDGNNRLVEETIQTRVSETATAVDQSSTAYTYDAANNRATKRVTRIAAPASSAEAGENEVGFWEYTYNTSNQLTLWAKWDVPNGSLQKTATVAYDEAGNRTGESIQTQGVSTPAIKTYTWDAQDRLRGVTMPDGSVHGYQYDYRTRRIGTSTATTVNSTTTTKQTAIVFSGGLSLAEWESSTGTLPTAPTVEYTRGPDMGGGVGGLLYSLRDESGTVTPKYNLSNGRGDIVAQSNQSAALTWTASYEAYGKRTKETQQNKDKQRANSKDEDPTGLLNEGFRYRDLETGVWLSRDPAGFVDGPNLYAYVKQNPWTAFDPLGLMDSIGVIINGNHYGIRTHYFSHEGWTSIFQFGVPYKESGATGTYEPLFGVWDAGLDVGKANVDAVASDPVPYVKGFLTGESDGSRSGDVGARNSDALALLSLGRSGMRISGGGAGPQPQMVTTNGTVMAAPVAAVPAAAPAVPASVLFNESGGSPEASQQEQAKQNEKQTGSYTNLHESGKTYSGKGDKQRSQTSGERVEKETGDKHVATDWTQAPNNREAFKQESRRLDTQGTAKSEENYNKIESPGKKMREEDGD